MRSVVPFRRHLAWAVPLAVVALGAACGGGSSRTKPAEVPIGQFEPGKPGSNDPASFGGPSAQSGAADIDSGAADSASAEKGDASADKAADVGASVAADPNAIAGKLDDKNGFAGASFGAGPRTLHGAKSQDKKGADPAHYRGASSYGGVPLQIDYTFSGGKLASMAFTAKKNADCKKLKESLEKELGTPQKSTQNPEIEVWRGNKIGLKYTGGVTCGGLVVSKDLAANDFSSLDQ